MSSLQELQVPLREFRGRHLLLYLTLVLCSCLAMLVLPALLGAGGVSEDVNVYRRVLMLDLGVAVAGVLGLSVLVIRRPRNLGVSFSTSGFIVPRSWLFRSTVEVPYAKVVSAVHVWPRPFRRILITRQRGIPLNLPVWWFESESDLERIADRIREGVLAGPGAGRRAQWRSAEEMAQRCRHFHWPTAIGALVLTVAYLLQTQLGSPRNVIDLYTYGANASWLTLHGQWYRIGSATFLHAGVAHLASNVLCLLALGQLMGPALGAARMALLFVAGVVGGGLLSAMFQSAASVGSSTGLWGLMGGWMLLSITCRRALPPPFGLSLVVMAIFIGSDVVLKLVNPQVDSFAHAGGALGGMLVAGLIVRDMRLEGNRQRASSSLRAAAILSISLLIGCGAWAFGFGLIKGAPEVVRLSLAQISKDDAIAGMGTAIGAHVCFSKGVSRDQIVRASELTALDSRERIDPGLRQTILGCLAYRLGDLERATGLTRRASQILEWSEVMSLLGRIELTRRAEESQVSSSEKANAPDRWTHEDATIVFDGENLRIGFESPLAQATTFDLLIEAPGESGLLRFSMTSVSGEKAIVPLGQRELESIRGAERVTIVAAFAGSDDAHSTAEFHPIHPDLMTLMPLPLD